MSNTLPRWLAELLHEEHVRAGFPEGSVVLPSDLDNIQPAPSDVPEKPITERDLPSSNTRIILPSDGGKTER